MLSSRRHNGGNMSWPLSHWLHNYTYVPTDKSIDFHQQEPTSKSSGEGDLPDTWILTPGLEGIGTSLVLKLIMYDVACTLLKDWIEVKVRWTCLWFWSHEPLFVFCDSVPASHTTSFVLSLVNKTRDELHPSYRQEKISHQVANFMLTLCLWGKDNGNLSCLKMVWVHQRPQITVYRNLNDNRSWEIWDFFPTFLYFVNVPAHPRFGPRGGAPPRHSGQEKGNKITPEKHVLRKLHTFHNLTRPGLPWDPSPSPL